MNKPESSDPSISILGCLLLGYISLWALLTFVVIFTANLFLQTKHVPKMCRALSCLKQTKRYEIPLPNEGKDFPPKEPTRFEDSERCWKEITTKIDRFCFVTFLILYALQLMVYCVIVLKWETLHVSPETWWKNENLLYIQMNTDK